MGIRFLILRVRVGVAAIIRRMGKWLVGGWVFVCLRGWKRSMGLVLDVELKFIYKGIFANFYGVDRCSEAANAQGNKGTTTVSDCDKQKGEFSRRERGL